MPFGNQFGLRSSLICSSNFVENTCSKDPKSSSFIPKIFPKINKKKTWNHHQQTARYNRHPTTNDSGFLSKLELGDIILADIGFPGSKESCENSNCILVMLLILHHGRFTEI